MNSKFVARHFSESSDYGSPRMAAARLSSGPNLGAKLGFDELVLKRTGVERHLFIDNVGSKGSAGSGLAFDANNHVLFVYYCQPSPTVIRRTHLREQGDAPPVVPMVAGSFSVLMVGDWPKALWHSS
jgi:hypothetical protein